MVNYLFEELTNKEQLVVTALVDGLYAEPGFSDVEASDIVKNLDGQLNDHQVASVLSQLLSKGIIFSDDGHCVENLGSLIYLEETHYHLHPVWSKEV